MRSGRRVSALLVLFASVMVYASFIFAMGFYHHHYAPGPLLVTDKMPTKRPLEEWSSPVLFHAVNKGLRVEGAFLVGKLASKFATYLENNSTWPVVRQCGKAHLCTRAYTEGKCVWCPRRGDSPCIQGTLTASHSKEDRNMTFTRQTSIMAARRSWAHPESQSAKPRYSTYWFQCDLESAMPPQVQGELTVENLGGFSATVAGYRGSEGGDDHSVVCTRGLFGDLDASQLASFVDFYVNHWGFNRVVAYGIGMDRDLARDGAVARQIATGKLVWVDLRSELQRMYGYLWSDVVLFSHAIAQLPLKMDCLSRARKMGVTWVLNVDVDEMLVPGMDNAKRMVWKDVIQGKEMESWISFGLLDAHDTILCESRSFVGQWNEYLKLADARLKEVEWFNLNKRPPFRAMAKGCDPLMCNGASGGRKVAVRVNRNELHVPGIGVHEMRACALCVMDPPGWVVNASLLYLRHNSCLNFAPPGGRGLPRERVDWFLNSGA
jgi:hypothetical protein